MSSNNETMLLPYERQIMLEEIARVGLTLGRLLVDSDRMSRLTNDEIIPLSPKADSTQTATPLERLYLLETLWPEIEAALMRLTQPPRSALTSSPVRMPAEMSSGNARTAAAIARNPQLAAAWQHNNRGRPRVIQADKARNEFPPAERMEVAPHDFPPLYVQQSRAQICDRIPLNRFIVMLLIELEREAQHLEALSVFCADTSGKERARRIGRSVAYWRARIPFAGLAPLTASEWTALRQSATVARWEPAARSLYHCRLALHSPLHFDWSHSPLLWSPALEGWHLYEIWCFMRVAACLLKQRWQPVNILPAGGRSGAGMPVKADAVDDSADGCLVRCTPDGLRLCLTTGRASELRFRSCGAHGKEAVLTLTYQPYFPSANQRRMSRATTSPSQDPGCYSLSHAMQPDISLQWRGRIYLLDAKYRRYGLREQSVNGAENDYNALLEDIDKMHTYRDSIVQSGDDVSASDLQPPIPWQRRAVRHAWCLFPGSPSATPEIIAYPAGTPEHPFGSAGIGAISLRPGQAPQALEQLMEEWLSDPTP